MSEQKRALITGASGAIGQAICRTLAADGYAIIAHAFRNVQAAEDLVAELSQSGYCASFVAFDVTDRTASHQALEALLESGPIQTVISNAGLHDDAPMAGMSFAQWNRVVDVSLNGFFNVTQPILLPMMRTRWGRILAISSVAGITGNRGQSNYAAAKAGLHGAVKSLALECASRGVTVNAVAPGIIATPGIEDIFPPARIQDLVPMKRAGKVEEVADMVGFLVSEKASYVTGQIISVNGGMA